MTICSWRTQSPERPLNFVRPHAKLHSSKARSTITSFLLNRHLALCRGLKSEGSILRNDKQMTESSSCSLLKHVNRESNVLP